MVEKIKLMIGDKISLLGPNGGPLPDEYEVIEIIDSDRIKIRDKHGVDLRTFKSRIIHDGGWKMNTNNVGENKVTEQTVAEGAVNTSVSDKKEKTIKVPPPIDLKEYCEQHGGADYLLMIKKNSFGAEAKGQKYSSTSYVLINQNKHTYRTFNVYTYANGVMSLGRRGSAGNEYPLKGRNILTQKCTTKDGSVVSKPYKAKHTVDEKVEEFKKKGYEVIKL